jgi:hypothetical protein
LYFCNLFNLTKNAIFIGKCLDDLLEEALESLSLILAYEATGESLPNPSSVDLIQV